MAFPWKIREIAGNLPSSAGNFWKQRNLREFSGNGYGRFKCCFWECYASQQFRGKTTGKISHSPIHQGLISLTYIYPWWIGEWPAYTPIMAFIFTLWKSLCYVMDLKLIDVINVSYMLYISYLLQILPAFSKWIVKWKETEKQRIVDFDGKCKPGLLYGDGGEDAKIFDHIL